MVAHGEASEQRMHEPCDLEVLVPDARRFDDGSDELPQLLAERRWVRQLDGSLAQLVSPVKYRVGGSDHKSPQTTVGGTMPEAGGRGQ